jgi:isoquinoline 1-oxidoreductase alpha subunit
MALTLSVNGAQREVQARPDTPLLYVLRNELELSGPQYGCGLAQCGACAVLVDGKAIRSCTTPVSQVGTREVTTLEGLPARWAARRGVPATAGAALVLHPVQQAWIEEQTPLCGFCQNGMMIKATELLERTPTVTVAQIKAAFTNEAPSPHLCRCGSYTAIIEAVQRASTLLMSRGSA